MADASSGNRVSVTHLILVPSIITLAVTILRLVGELNHWSNFWFNREAGGGFAPIGIGWLAPVFGIYFAFKLARRGEGTSSAGRVILSCVVAILLIVVAAFLTSKFISPQPDNAASIAVLLVATVAAILIMSRPWPSLFRTLIVYGYAARIPVAIVMLFAIRGNWGTHYDVKPSPDFPDMSWFMKWLLIGAAPQLILWILITVTSGLLFGGIAIAIFHREKQSAQAAHA